MEESIRLVCPDCDMVYRVKRVVPGKIHTCRECGGVLATLPEGAGDIVTANLAAASSSLDVAAALSDPPPSPSPADDAGPDGNPARPGRRAERDAAEQLHAIGEKVAELAGRLDPARLDALADLVRRTGEDIAARLDAHRAALGSELSALREGGMPAASVEPAIDPESGSVVDALARVADELVREQSANTSRLDRLSDDIRTATVSIGQWQGTFPDRVADEIGRTVEDRVVGPISGALARQAPAILSELQDSKLVDIVSRSIREAQRPLLREVVAGGGRGGVPVWLFASVLLPLLLVLGYLFLPGEIGGSDAGERARLEAEIVSMADGVHRVESVGLSLAMDADARLKNVEEVVLDLHGQALAHAKNAAALEEETKGLRETLAERDRLIKEYSEMLQKQVKRIRAYETRLSRLGVSPDSVEE